LRPAGFPMAIALIVLGPLVTAIGVLAVGPAYAPALGEWSSPVIYLGLGISTAGWIWFTYLQRYPQPERSPLGDF